MRVVMQMISDRAACSDKGFPLPSGWRTPTTATIGLFAISADELATWLLRGFNEGDKTWMREPASSSCLGAAIGALEPLADVGRSKVLIFEIGGWSALLDNGRRGTDLGMLPSLSARDLSTTGIRATVVEDGPGAYAATILEVYSPEGSGPLKCRRVVSAANDAGRWVFQEYGVPYGFEDLSRYRRKRVRDRFDPQRLYAHLHEIVGTDIKSSAADMSRAVLIREVIDAA